MGLGKRLQGFQSVAFCSRPAPLRKPVKKALVAYWARVDLRPHHCLVLHLQIFPQGPTPDVGTHRGGPSRSVGRSFSPAYHLKASCRRLPLRPSTFCAKLHSTWVCSWTCSHAAFHQKTLKSKPGSSTLGGYWKSMCPTSIHFASRWVPRAVIRGAWGVGRKNYSQSAPPSLPGI